MRLLRACIRFTQSGATLKRPLHDRGRAEGGAAYEGQVPEAHSLLYSLMNAQRKDDGRPLSDLHICAQAFTFVLAGQQCLTLPLATAVEQLCSALTQSQCLQGLANSWGNLGCDLHPVL